MVPVTDLWLPVLLSAVAVFVASSIIHLVIGYHRSDVAGLPKEDAVGDAMRGAAPGDYYLPYATPAEMKDGSWVEKCKKGPVAFVTVMPDGPPNMGKNMGLWFLYCVVAGLLVGVGLLLSERYIEELDAMAARWEDGRP